MRLACLYTSLALFALPLALGCGPGVPEGTGVTSEGDSDSDGTETTGGDS